jgi:DNA-binding Xre family transcriptional regulator
MELQPRIKALVIEKGYNSLADFSERENVSYYMLRRLAYKNPKSIEVPFLIELCKKLDCQISDLLVLKN